MVFKKLPIKARKAVETLGYTEDKWDNHGWPESSDKWFEDLTPEEREKMKIAELPGSLAEALHLLDEDEVLKDALGASAYESFSRAKWSEVDEYRTRVTDWEVNRYLETT